MIRNEKLLIDIEKSLSALLAQQKLNPVLTQELSAANQLIKQQLADPVTQSSFFTKVSDDECLQRVKQKLMHVIAEIDKAGLKIETEMHGVSNYSEYELNRIQAFENEQTVREALLAIITTIPTKTAEFKPGF